MQQLNRFQILDAEEKAIQLIEAGKKIQLEIDKKNNVLKVFEVSIKRITLEVAK